MKLLATGSSNLATEEYVDDAIAQGGGGGNVDLSNYYTQTETDYLKKKKLNDNNPQDTTGNLRLDPTNGNSKSILNAVAPATASDDFYCNGNGHFNGSFKVSLLTSEGDLNADGCNADTFNTTDNSLKLSKDLNMGTSTSKCNTFDSGLNDVVFHLNSSE